MDRAMHELRHPFIETVRACMAWAVALCAGCGDGASAEGNARVLLEAESVIVDGLDPGEGLENVRDGWSVRFDEYLVAIGDLDLHFASDEHVEAEAPEVFAVDLTEVPADGLALWNLDGLQEGRWELSYAVVGPSDDAAPHDSVSAADFDTMVDSDLTYLVRGELAKSDGQSCPPASLATPPSGAISAGENAGGDPCYPNPALRFELSADDHTSYGPCEVDGVPGFAVAAGRTQTVALTLHGDHLFFNGFPEGGESGVMRLAQWLADCDLDLDGLVTDAELDAISPAALPELDGRFQLGGAPLQPLDTMHTYVRAQLKTQGHFQGEGECQVDGTADTH
jgi:hypothetical protein